jgi:hypothetical protein
MKGQRTPSDLASSCGALENAASGVWPVITEKANEKYKIKP